MFFFCFFSEQVNKTSKDDDDEEEEEKSERSISLIRSVLYVLERMIQKYLPFVNFLIATTALGFQITVLYPWHYELQQEFNDLQKQQEEKLRQYHELKMQTIKNIESNLLKLRREKTNEKANAQRITH